jgi:YggT family protein
MFIVANFLLAIAKILDIALTLYMFIIIARAVISWVNPDPYNSIVRFLYAFTEPVLYRIRRILPLSFIAAEFWWFRLFSYHPYPGNLLLSTICGSQFSSDCSSAWRTLRMNKRRPPAKDITLKVKVTPRSSMSKIVGLEGDTLRVRVASPPVDGSANQDMIGLEGDTLRVRVTSPPVDGSANQDMIKLLSRGLGVRKDKIEILSGQRSRLKTIRIHGMTKDELFLVLNK